MSRNPDYYRDGTINWVRTTDLNNGVLSGTEIKITSKAYDSCHLTILPINSVCVAMYGGGGTIGKHSIIKFSTTINQSVCAIMPNGICDMDYFHLFIEYQRPSWMDFASGSRKDPNINQIIIKHCLFPIPPIQEQKRIVKKTNILIPFLCKYGQSQETLDKLNTEINAKLRKSILQEAIQGKLVPQIAEEGTAQELLEQIKEEKQKLVKAGKLKKSALTDSVIYKGDDNKYYEQIGKTITCIAEQILFEIPENWTWIRLNSIANLYTGNSISESEKLSKYSNVSGTEYIGTKDIGFNHTVNYENGISIPNRYVSKFKIAPSQSILLCIEGGSAGKKIAQIDRNLCFGNKLCCLVPYNMAIARYIYFYLQAPSFFEAFRGNIAGIIGGVSVNTLKTLLVPLPSILEQQRIVVQIEKLFEQLR